VQACADDPQVCYHAVRNLARLGRNIVSPFWAVLGFGRASAGPGQQTPRNLLGFKDGTRNVTSEAEYARFVWVDNGDQPWMNGGTYQVVRKIRMLLETWDVDRIGNQQKIFGRTKQEGAPLSGKAEFDTPNFTAKGPDGTAHIDPLSHVGLAARENNDGIMIRRRSYNYTDGLDPNGQLNAGLLFISYQKDPQDFIRLQNRLGANDLLNEYIRHIGSRPQKATTSGKSCSAERISIACSRPPVAVAFQACDVSCRPGKSIRATVTHRRPPSTNPVQAKITSRYGGTP
jgi:deferrochelatase/peroxidase EfeB